METLIKNCLNAGWRIQEASDGKSTVSFLTPPENDPRLSWCATWEPVSYEGKSVLVPHWADPTPYKEPK